ncbi:polysaccharide deacetylase family protein [Methyloraptor flagellatus]|uniref:Chitooligosaccharide deacetylase n=1 Tax=Methyloraptor flagellatus TaxID=3162530 RepID=A0AAU7XCR1_9HYPH
MPAEARRAIQIANLTAQATPPVHNHVSIPVKTQCPGNPDAIGVSRVIKVDTTGGFYVGQTYLTRMPTLEPKEVILTFDDGPMAGRTDRVLAALDHECTKATFFIVGQMAKAYPETLRKTAAAGHTIGYHTMTHPLELRKWPFEKASGNIRDGWQTVDHILYGTAGDKPATPFFRYPGLFNSRPVNEWFNQMGVGVFAIDAAGNDWLKNHLTLADGPNVLNEALKELEARNGGILLLHDIKDSSSSIVAPLLVELKKRGFKIVHIMPKNPPPALVAGPVQASFPTIAETTLPVQERRVGTYGTAQQLAQEQAGRSGKNSAQPLPTYQPQTALAVPAAPAVNARPLPSAAAAVEPLTTQSVPTTQAAALPPQPADDGWFASTASAFRGMGNAIGLW